MSELPRGTVTFLFTDIEGSTRLLQELGAERYAAELERHRQLVRGAFEPRGGYEVDCEGDAFFVAFARASDAVEAAAEAQRALAGGPISVRMGLHTGEPLLAPPKYVGLDVHRAARVMAAGHGGQVLISEATRAQLDDAVALSDLGLHRLKDLSEPQRLFQLGKREFPPLKTLYATNLPVQASPLIGRKRELTDAAALLGEHRLVTLTGPGGSGKTRLALQLAADNVEVFEDGVWWVPLQAVRDPALVEATIGQTLGARNGLSEHVGSRRMLLLLDNIEQVLEAVPALASLLAATPHLKLVVTSREPMRIAGEQQYPVEPLAEVDAVELFGARAAQAEPLAAVVEICRRLDFLPLAIELAAARTTLLTPLELLARLERRLPLLTGGRRDAPERQRTLRATIEWSHELLSPAEQCLFARLAAFAGSFDIQAAEQICEADLDLLQSLVEKNLVRRWGSGRFGMLETIHEYAEARLERSGEAVDIRLRHGAHFLELAQELAPYGYVTGAEALERLRPERENLRRALEAAAERRDAPFLARAVGILFSVWLGDGSAREGIRWSEIALADRERLSPSDLLHVLLAASELLRFVGDLDSAESLKLEVLELGRSHEESAPYVPAMLADLAEIAIQRGDLGRARSYAEESVDEGGGPRAASSLGEVALQEGDYEAAARLFERAAEGYRGVHDLNYAYALEALGEAKRRSGKCEEARWLFEDAARRFAEMGDQPNLAECLEGLGAIALEAGDRERAGTMAGAAAQMRESAGVAPWRKERRLDDLPEPALARGRAMNLDQAVAYALEGVEAP